jgi:hypothetical protein
MSGPSGVDDILKTFDEVRRAEAASNIFQPAGGFATQPAVSAAISVAEDLQSQAESARTGASGNQLRPRRKRAQAPVGNTVSLNV